ncbi:ChrR family anti-sigma-E factor [Tropicibacter naphthalenivorans]|uniref:Transcriptional activator ChrR n=1 Tax=Tropicibacter naphthalenivorans TaxID=441103 RepID=A0A0P1GFL5_9RHOB|nr:ChrR family anti-sigma-E factor [Tropicibacter naphthalenivorans]CUH79923.1 Transcriptional activator ChrR [Tropicibacter naphthalenivorans]SMC76159.1 anti-ECFsigma factor, ChrR [Tropicibacter naphthalenivorans]
MTTIHHHLTDDLLMGYSAGTLSEAVNLIVATHVSLCDDCRAGLASYDAIGGALLDECAESVSDDCLSGALAAIRSEAPIEVPLPVRDPTVPAPLAGYIGGALSDVKWRPVGMGVKQAILKTSPEATARLLYIPAGTAVPDHSHNGLELTLVLKGAFEDQEGRFARGDIEIADDDVQHMPVADISEDCICLAVTDAPLRFKDWLPRLAQPFLRI